jgi:hypothetical protein
LLVLVIPGSTENQRSSIVSVNLSSYHWYKMGFLAQTAENMH